MKRRRVFCKTCSSVLIRNGTDRYGKQRFVCTHCKQTSHYPSPSAQHIYLQLFRQYVLFGLTYEILTYQSKLSIATLHKSFTRYLDHEPPPSLPPLPTSTHHVLLIDGLWFNRWFVLMMYRESGNLKILRISTGQKELKRTIVRDLLLIKESGFICNGITTDGGKPILGAIQKVHPTLPHQVCLAHMHRAVIANLGRYPKELHVRFLKQIADLVWYIRTKEQKELWSLLVDSWIQRHKEFLEERRVDDTGRSWYVHRKVRNACRLLDTVYFHSFVFLDYPYLPKTTNEIEAQFGHLGKRWLAHRGLHHTRWESFIKWFAFFYNEEQDKKQRKTV